MCAFLGERKRERSARRAHAKGVQGALAKRRERASKRENNGLCLWRARREKEASRRASGASAQRVQCRSSGNDDDGESKSGPNVNKTVQKRSP